MESTRIVRKPLSRSAAISNFEDAVEAARKGDDYTAIAFLNTSLRNDPQHRPSRKLRPTLLIRTNQFSNAEQSLISSTELARDDGELWTLLGLARSRQGNYESSLEALNEAVRIRSDTPEVFINRAMLNFTTGKDFDAVISDCKRAERLGNQTAVMFDLKARALSKLGDHARAHRMHERAVKKDPKNAEWLRSWCDTYLAQGNLEMAISMVEQALVIDPDSPDSLILRATCSYEGGKNKAAKDLIDVAKLNGAVGPKADLLHARVLYRLDEFGKAALFAEDAVDLASAPDDMAFRSECLFRNERLNDAWIWIQHAISRDKMNGLSHPDPKKLQLASQIEHERGNRLSAYNLLTQSVNHPEHPNRDFLELAVRAQDCQRWVESLDWLGRVATTDRNAEVWFIAGHAFENLDSHINSLKCYSESLAKSPEAVPAQLGRVRVLMEMKRFNEASEQIERLGQNKDLAEEASSLRSKLSVMTYQPS